MISIHGLQKDYTGFSGPLDRIISGLSFGFAGGKVRFTALKNINLEIGSGEIVGIIGQNGAGKSTLLKIISGVSSFEKGELKTNGSLRSILELGVGFNPELSGRENVFYNGLVWGFSPAEMKILSPEIFRFSGMEDFIDVPLKNYSSGMVMRLGFALATANRPDILLVDEALAVGDAVFQQKSLQRFRDFHQAGSSVVIVSHDLNLLKSLCTRILVMDHGKIIYDGAPARAYEEYMKVIGGSKHSGVPTGEFASVKATLVANNQTNPKVLAVGSKVALNVTLKPKADMDGLTVGFHITDSKGLRSFGTNTHLMKKSVQLKKGRTATCTFDFPLNLGPGKYSVGVSVHRGESHADSCYYWNDNAITLELENFNFSRFEGSAWLPVRFSLKNK